MDLVTMSFCMKINNCKKLNISLLKKVCIASGFEPSMRCYKVYSCKQSVVAKLEHVREKSNSSCHFFSGVVKGQAFLYQRTGGHENVNRAGRYWKPEPDVAISSLMILLPDTVMRKN